VAKAKYGGPSEREAPSSSPEGEEKKKVYLLETKSGSQRKLTVPRDWKVTFGPTVPFERKNSGRYDECWALRLYEGDKLRAVLTDVRNFRDLDIEVLEKRISSKRQVIEKASKKGGKTVVAEAKIEKWVDPDDPEEAGTTPEEYLRLAYDPEKDENKDLEW
jgi:hypothetical protein